MAGNDATHSNSLESLAQRWLHDNSLDMGLSEAEQRMLRALPKGREARCGPNPDEEEPDKNEQNDPANADASWGKEREIRADLIRWLCVNQVASKMADPRGIRIYAAKITGPLDLSFATVPFPLSITRCRLASDSDLRSVKIPELSFDGSHAGSLNLDNSDVRGDVSLSNGFSASSDVRLLNARIGGSLYCADASFAKQSNAALFLSGAHVSADIVLTSCKAEGPTLLIGTRVGRSVDCAGSTFRNHGGMALKLEGAEIGGGVLLRNGFTADGTVDLFETQIGETLDCGGGVFDRLELEAAVVKGSFFWSDGASISGQLSLRNASVGTMVDWASCWPSDLYLDGFVYERFADDFKVPKDARTRLKWLEIQRDFTPQPYRQLAKVLRERADEDGAKEVLFELERRGRATDRRELVLGPTRAIRFMVDTLSELTVGYGIYPKRAVWELSALVAVGWAVHRRALLAGAMAPKDKDAYKEFHDNKGVAPPSYQPFVPVIYTLENCVPLVKLGQDDQWQPDPHPLGRLDSIGPAQGWRARLVRRIDLTFVRLPVPAPAVLRWLRWSIIGLGWLLATFFVAGLTGIIKTN